MSNSAPASPGGPAEGSAFRKPPRPPRAHKRKGAQPKRAASHIRAFLAVGVLLVAIVWYGISSQGGSQRFFPGTPASTPVEPQIRASESRAATEALQALKALQSVTTTGVAYHDYAGRVVDTKIQVDEYLQGEGADSAVKSRVREAMTLYVLSSSAWNAKLTEGYYGFEVFERVGRHPALQLCPEVTPLLAASRPAGVRRTPETKRTPEANKGIHAADNFRALWSCASSKITEAEETLAALSAATAPRSLTSLDFGDLPSVEVGGKCVVRGMRLEDVGDLFLNHPRWEFRRDEEMVLKEEFIATLVPYPRDAATESPYLLLFSVTGTKASGDARLTRIGWTGRLESAAKEALSERAGCQPR